MGASVCGIVVRCLVSGQFTGLEWLFVALCRNAELDVYAFQFYRKRGVYLKCVGLLLLEYIAELYMVPWLKCSRKICCLGWITSGCMWATCQDTGNRRDHTLVTYGIYRYLRHPSYTGYFWWTVGLCILMGNPISVIVFPSVMWSTYRSRVKFEEETLQKMFGQEYTDYKKQTFIGIPLL
ncbi:Protein-S-isoprenylcysteine O-methyltransferase [Pelomyxa schiedti]|nr:Protein-S-isoprenylcysteine O-methyltransferase [Pelomyxa schiedti]